MNKKDLILLEKQTKLKCPRTCNEEFTLFELLDEDTNKRNFRSFIHESLDAEKKEIEEQNKKNLNSALLGERTRTEEAVTLKLENSFEKTKSNYMLEINDWKNKLETQKTTLELALHKSIEQEIKNSNEYKKLLASQEQLIALEKKEIGWEKDKEIALKTLELSKNKEISELEQAVERKNNAQINSRLKGEELHTEILKILEMMYAPQDVISTIVAGKKGADIIQNIRDDEENVICTLLYEIKNVTRWDPAWVPKFQNDLKLNNANFGLIISTVFPADKKHLKFFEVTNNIYALEADEFTIKTVVDVYRKIWMERSVFQKRIKSSSEKSQITLQKLNAWEKTVFKENIRKISDMYHDFLRKADKIKSDIDSSSVIVSNIVKIVTSEIHLTLKDIID